MDSEKLIQKIVDKTTAGIINRVYPEIRESVEELVNSLASATVECMRTCGDCPCTEGDEEQEDSELEEKAPVGIEIRTKGVKLSADNRLRFSRMICDFLRDLEEPQEDEPPIAEDERVEDDDEDPEVKIEQVIIKIDRHGVTTFERKISDLDAGDDSDK